MSATIEQEQTEQIAQNLAQDQAEAFNPDQRQQTSHIQSRKTPEELEQQREVDSRSIYIGNVDYKSTPDEIEAYFAKVGAVNRVTILLDKYTGYPKGYAYVEFEKSEEATKAIEELSGTTFKERIISVVAKRTNLPGFRSSRGRGGFRGRGRGGFRGNFRGSGFRGGRGGYNNNYNGKPVDKSENSSAPSDAVKENVE